MLLSIQEAARKARGVIQQTNLTHVTQEFQEALRAVWAEARRTGKGPAWVHQHPIVVVYADRVAALAGVAGNTHFVKNRVDAAHRALEELLKEAA